MTNHVCTCPLGYRSTHCALHGTCNCCHGARCPTHDEPKQLIPLAPSREPNPNVQFYYDNGQAI